MLKSKVNPGSRPAIIDRSFSSLIARLNCMNSLMAVKNISAIRMPYRSDSQVNLRSDITKSVVGPRWLIKRFNIRIMTTKMRFDIRLLPVTLRPTSVISVKTRTTHIHNKKTGCDTMIIPENPIT